MQDRRPPAPHALTRHAAVLLVLSFEAGLATGLARFPAPEIALAGLAGLGLLLHTRPAAWLPAAGALGLAAGLGARAAAGATCEAVFREGVRTVVVRLREPVRSGIALAEPRGCRGGVALRVRGDTAYRAGDLVRVQGRWIPSPRFGGRPDGILVAQRIHRLESRPGLGDRVRNWTTETTARLYGTRSGLVDALLLGKRGGIDPALNAAFARSGLVHLLSISGFHVGVIFGWTLLLFRLARVPRVRASALAAVLVVLYVGFLGWPAPAARAALLCLIVAWSTARQRQPAAGPLLAVTCLAVSLLDPWAVFDLGAWLSVSALAGAMTATRWSDRALGEGTWWRLLFASLGATFATAPLTAAALGAVALAGIALNFAAIPLAAVAVPTVLASVLLAPVLSPFAESLAAAGGAGLAALELMARVGSTLPWGAFTMEPGPAAAIPWLAVLGMAGWIVGRRNTSALAVRRIGWVAGIAGIAMLFPSHISRRTSHGSSGLSLHFLSVGQGDATLIRTPAGRWILVDAGPAVREGWGRDAGRDVVAPFLIRHGARRLAAFVLSHAHLDHGGGAVAVLGRLPTDLVLEPAVPVAEPHYLALLDLIAERAIPWRAARAGDSLVVDGVRLSILHPDTTWAGWRADLNDDSVVLLIRAGNFAAVLAGDLGVRAESLLARHVGAVDVLKVGHHGSAGSSGAGWLAALTPRVGIVSVGANRYGHPAPQALARLADAGVEVWRTDREGTIQVTVDDSSMTVRGRRTSRRHVTR